MLTNYGWNLRRTRSMCGETRSVFILSVLQTMPLHYYFVYYYKYWHCTILPLTTLYSQSPLPEYVVGLVFWTLLGFITGTAQKTMLPHCVPISSRHFALIVDAIVMTTCKRNRQCFMFRFWSKYSHRWLELGLSRIRLTVIPWQMRFNADADNCVAFRCHWNWRPIANLTSQGSIEVSLVYVHTKS